MVKPKGASESFSYFLESFLIVALRTSQRNSHSTFGVLYRFQVRLCLALVYFTFPYGQESLRDRFSPAFLGVNRHQQLTKFLSFHTVFAVGLWTGNSGINPTLGFE
jgi:hypothetical protein